MRAPLALIVLGVAAGPSAALAAALPPPPYAADPQFQTQGPAQQPASAPPRGGDRHGGGDRYSGGQAHPVAAPAPQRYAFAPPPAAAPASPGRTLGWAGKTEAAIPAPAPQPAMPPPPQGGWRQMAGRWAAPPSAPRMAEAAARPTTGAYPAYRPAAPAAWEQGWRPLYPAAVAQPPVQAQVQAPAARPRTIYDPPAAPSAQAVPQAPAQPQRQARAEAPSGPRFYSLHREYGITPDPIPIPPQFFGPTADLSAPPPDPVLKRVTDANGQTHTQAVPDQGG